MPKYDLKSVQKELDADRIWPLYWVYGPETYKVRDFLKRIRKTLLGSIPLNQQSWYEESFEAPQAEVIQIVDASRSLVFGGGTRLILVRNADTLKDAEELLKICHEPKSRKDLLSVCVCVAKDLDGRKKVSKQLAERAAIIACEEVAESQRETWVRYLAQLKSTIINEATLNELVHLEPWSLDIIHQELEKVALSSDSGAVSRTSSSSESLGGTDVFLEHFFNRNVPQALLFLQSFAQQTDQTLLLLGLLNWNIRQIASLVYDQEKGTQYTSISSYHVDKLRRWSTHWKLFEVIHLQRQLSDMDFQLKQTPLLPLSLWSDLLFRCVSQSSNERRDIPSFV